MYLYLSYGGKIRRLRIVRVEEQHVVAVGQIAHKGGAIPRELHRGLQRDEMLAVVRQGVVVLGIEEVEGARLGSMHCRTGR